MLHPLSAVEIEFPKGVYADVRLERTADHKITLRDGVLDDVQSQVETGALIRVLKDGRWAYASTTDLEKIDQTLAELAAADNLPPSNAPVGVEQLAIHQDTVWVFDDERVDYVPLSDKLHLLKRHTRHLDRDSIATWTARWMDQHRDRRFVSSRGADVQHDYQECGYILSFSMTNEKDSVQERFSEASHRFSDLRNAEQIHGQEVEETLDKCERFLSAAVPVAPGYATVILSPEAAGIFAHESFGHKSEADFMLGDPAMLEAWKIGTEVGSPILSIIDSGRPFGSGYMPYDDEGQPASDTHLIEGGILKGRLHNALTSSALQEPHTANARAISFRFEPIVRMTTTTIAPGTDTRDSLFAGVRDGYFIETVKHGSGMSTFTIAPGLAWRIRNGEIAEPVRIAVLTGTVFDTLGEIDGLSDQIEVPFLVGGGCGKMEQWPLSVGFGGPYVRVRRMNLA